MRGRRNFRLSALLPLPFVAWLPLAASCSPVAGGEGATAASVVHLESWFGGPEGLRGEASFKVKRSKSGREKELKVEVEHARPGAKHALTVDGCEIGQLITDLDGEAEFELLGDDARFLPAGCPELKVGSVIRVGELMELELKALERVVDLEALVAGPGKLAGKVTFRFDRLGDAISKEFQVKLTGGPANSVHPVTLNGVEVAELTIEDDGKGKLELSSRRSGALPSGFTDPAPGAAIQIGTLYSGVLQPRPEEPGG